VHALGQYDIGRQGQIQRRDAADFLQTRFDNLRVPDGGDNGLGLIVHDCSLWFRIKLKRVHPNDGTNAKSVVPPELSCGHY
jgi:hypothetical protein